MLRMNLKVGNTRLTHSLLSGLILLLLGCTGQPGMSTQPIAAPQADSPQARSSEAIASTVDVSRQERRLRVYHIGNSVTDAINYSALSQLAQSQQHEYIFGRHMIPGAPLQWIWEHRNEGFREEPFGYYPDALSKYEWDVLTLQPFDRHLTEADGDLAMLKKFIDLALPKSPNLSVYIYSRWPRREADGSLDFQQKWLREYTGQWDGTEETRDYFETVTQELRKAYPQLQSRILMVPVGDVFLELDRQMKAGKVPGYRNISQVYTDSIHLNNVGSYIVGCTFYATLFQESPQGLTADPYGVKDAQLARIIQDTVWNVVSAQPLAGVNSERPD
jgi:hypothetical protein